MRWFGTAVIRSQKHYTGGLQGQNVSFTNFHKANAITGFHCLSLTFVSAGRFFVVTKFIGNFKKMSDTNSSVSFNLDLPPFLCITKYGSITSK